MEFTFDSVPTAFGTDIGWSCSALAGGGNYQGLPRDQTAFCRNGVLFRLVAGIALRLHHKKRDLDCYCRIHGYFTSSFRQTHGLNAVESALVT